jgi:DNA polymerase I-like protein with 3'-5' exonuclease and polymerase domains
MLRILKGPQPKVGQNSGFDRKMLKRWGVSVGGPQEDLMLLHAIMRPQEYHSLSHIGGSETWAESWKAQFHAGKDDY